MSNKKHIDRLFQEKFKDFEVQPDKNVWANIEKQLNQDNKTSPIAIPLWYKIAGVASLLIITLTTAFFINDSQLSLTEDGIVNTNDSKSNKDYDNTSTNKTASGSIEKSTANSNLGNSEKNKTPNASTTNTFEANKIYNTGLNSSTGKNASVANTNNNIEKTETINNLKTANSNNSKATYNKHSTKSTTTNNSVIAATYNRQAHRNSSNKNHKTSQHNTGHVTGNIRNASAVALASSNSSQKTNKTNLSLTENTYTSNANNSEQSTYNTSKVNGNTTNNSTRIGIAIATNLNGAKMPLVTIKDSLTYGNLVIKDSHTIEAAIKANKKRLKKEAIGNRWTMSSNIAPVYYNSLGKGSQFGSQFANNNISGETNTSYGLKVGYALNKNLIIRSGVSKLNLSYDTDDVIVFESVSNTSNAKPMENIDFYTLPSNENLAVFSTNNLATQQINGNTNYNAAISQRINYIEIPVELEYKLSNNRFGVNLIGGFSTFVLEGNNVVSEFDGYKTDIGQANNINNVSFSTNIGVGLNYKFTKSFVYNLEPTFKYQVNGFSNTSGNFNPYIIGVYTGFSYKF